MTKKKISWIEYIFTHLIPTWFQSFGGNFRIWKDLMTGNYEDYALMWYDDPYEECVSWFWQSLGDDDTLSKEFLEHLMQMAEDVETGKVETYSLDEVLQQMKEWREEENDEQLIDNVIDKVDLNLN